jgi:hypothetical protein
LNLPLSILLALSLRTAYIEDKPFDYELSTSVEWTNLEVGGAYERESGAEYFNYSVVGGNGLIGDWDIECETRIHDASGINRQGLRILRRSDVFAVGGGIVASDYKTPVDPVYELRMGIPYGAVALSTDWSDVHIWKATLKHEFGGDKVRPFIKGDLLSDNGNKVYKIKFGVRWVL